MLQVLMNVEEVSVHLLLLPLIFPVGPSPARPTHRQDVGGLAVLAPLEREWENVLHLDTSGSSLVSTETRSDDDDRSRLSWSVRVSSFNSWRCHC